MTIPNELLTDIFLRLQNSDDLVRASAACVSFRRLVADRAFLREYRKLHAPPLLGLLKDGAFHPAVPPHPSAVAAAADFSFSFLPAPAAGWAVQDSRDGRVLLDRAPHGAANIDGPVFPELAVCDPLHRRYLLLPPIPAHLAASLKDPLWTDRHRYFCETFLAPPATNSNTEEEDETTSFSVVWMAQCAAKLVAFVFSSGVGKWRAISSPSWSDLLAGWLSRTGKSLFSCRQHAYGRFYWATEWREKLLVLDTSSMEFSVAEPPPEARGLHGVEIAVVEAGEGRTGMFMRPEYEDCLYYSVMQSSNSNRWQLERTVSLDFEFSVMGSAGSHLFLFQWQDKSCFSLDVRTFQLERLFVLDSCRPCGHTYSNYPPSLLSTPTISTGLENKAEKEMLEQSRAAISSAESPRLSEWF